MSYHRLHMIKQLKLNIKAANESIKGLQKIIDSQKLLIKEYEEIIDVERKAYKEELKNANNRKTARK